MQEQTKKLNKKGVSGVEIAVTIVVISIGLSIILSLFLIINKTSNKVNREISAIQIAKSILEKIKIISYTEFTDIIKDTSNENYSAALGINIPEGFDVEIVADTKTPTTIDEAIQFNIRKEGNIVIKYMVSNEMVELKLPYVKYFDNVIPRNKPDLNSTAIDSPNSYLSTELFIPVEANDGDYTPVSAEDMDNWYNQDKSSEESLEILAMRRNTYNDYDIFVWEPRMIPSEDDWIPPIYLVGRTMYALEPYVKTIEFPAGVYNSVVINILVEKTELPNTEDETGKWVFITSI